MVTSSSAGFEIGTDGPSLILVGVDGSRTSLRAAAYAAGLARRQGCRIAVVHVPHQPSGVDAGVSAAMIATSREMVEDLARQVEEGSAYIGLDVEFYVRVGERFREIAAIADELRADLVVVGASEHTGHRLVGSLATKLVRAGRWPVTVVP